MGVEGGGGGGGGGMDIFWNYTFYAVVSGFQSFVGFRIPLAVLRIPKPRIADPASKIFTADSGIRIPLHGANLLFFYNAVAYYSPFL